jgi:hypothetical protein
MQTQLVYILTNVANSPLDSELRDENCPPLLVLVRWLSITVRAVDWATRLLILRSVKDKIRTMSNVSSQTTVGNVWFITWRHCGKFIVFYIPRIPNALLKILKGWCLIRFRYPPRAFLVRTRSENKADEWGKACDLSPVKFSSFRNVGVKIIKITVYNADINSISIGISYRPGTFLFFFQNEILSAAGFAKSDFPDAKLSLSILWPVFFNTPH